MTETFCATLDQGGGGCVGAGKGGRSEEGGRAGVGRGEGEERKGEGVAVLDQPPSPSPLCGRINVQPHLNHESN